MITEPVPVPSQDTPKPRRSHQSARTLITQRRHRGESRAIVPANEAPGRRSQLGALPFPCAESATPRESGVPAGLPGCVPAVMPSAEAPYRRYARTAEDASRPVRFPIGAGAGNLPWLERFRGGSDQENPCRMARLPGTTDSPANATIPDEYGCKTVGPGTEKAAEPGHTRHRPGAAGQVIYSVAA